MSGVGKTSQRQSQTRNSSTANQRNSSTNQRNSNSKLNTNSNQRKSNTRGSAAENDPPSIPDLDDDEGAIPAESPMIPSIPANVAVVQGTLVQEEERGSNGKDDQYGKSIGSQSINDGTQSESLDMPSQLPSNMDDLHAQYQINQADMISSLSSITEPQSQSSMQSTAMESSLGSEYGDMGDAATMIPTLTSTIGIGNVGDKQYNDYKSKIFLLQKHIYNMRQTTKDLEDLIVNRVLTNHLATITNTYNEIQYGSTVSDDDDYSSCCFREDQKFRSSVKQIVKYDLPQVRARIDQDLKNVNTTIQLMENEEQEANNNLTSGMTNTMSSQIAQAGTGSKSILRDSANNTTAKGPSSGTTQLKFAQNVATSAPIDQIDEAMVGKYNSQKKMQSKTNLSSGIRTQTIPGPSAPGSPDAPLQKRIIDNIFWKKFKADIFNLFEEFLFSDPSFHQDCEDNDICLIQCFKDCKESLYKTWDISLDRDRYKMKTRNVKNLAGLGLKNPKSLETKTKLGQLSLDLQFYADCFDLLSVNSQKMIVVENTKDITNVNQLEPLTNQNKGKGGMNTNMVSQTSAQNMNLGYLFEVIILKILKPRPVRILTQNVNFLKTNCYESVYASAIGKWENSEMLLKSDDSANTADNNTNMITGSNANTLSSGFVPWQPKALNNTSDNSSKNYQKYLARKMLLDDMKIQQKANPVPATDDKNNVVKLQVPIHKEHPPRPDVIVFQECNKVQSNTINKEIKLKNTLGSSIKTPTSQSDNTITNGIVAPVSGTNVDSDSYQKQSQTESQSQPSQAPKVISDPFLNFRRHLYDEGNYTFHIVNKGLEDAHIIDGGSEVMKLVAQTTREMNEQQKRESIKKQILQSQTSNSNLDANLNWIGNGSNKTPVSSLNTGAQAGTSMNQYRTGTGPGIIINDEVFIESLRLKDKFNPSCINCKMIEEGQDDGGSESESESGEEELQTQNINDLENKNNDDLDITVATTHLAKPKAKIPKRQLLHKLREEAIEQGKIVITPNRGMICNDTELLKKLLNQYKMRRATMLTQNPKNLVVKTEKSKLKNLDSKDKSKTDEASKLYQLRNMNGLNEGLMICSAHQILSKHNGQEFSIFKSTNSSVIWDLIQKLSTISKKVIESSKNLKFDNPTIDLTKKQLISDIIRQNIKYCKICKDMVVWHIFATHIDTDKIIELLMNFNQNSNKDSDTNRTSNKDSSPKAITPTIPSIRLTNDRPLVSAVKPAAAANDNVTITKEQIQQIQIEEVINIFIRQVIESDNKLTNTIASEELTKTSVLESNSKDTTTDQDQDSETTLAAKSLEPSAFKSDISQLSSDVEYEADENGEIQIAKSKQSQKISLVEGNTNDSTLEATTKSTKADSSAEISAKQQLNSMNLSDILKNGFNNNNIILCGISGTSYANDCSIIPDIGRPVKRAEFEKIRIIENGTGTSDSIYETQSQGQSQTQSQSSLDGCLATIYSKMSNETKGQQTQDSLNTNGSTKSSDSSKSPYTYHSHIRKLFGNLSTIDYTQDSSDNDSDVDIDDEFDPDDPNTGFNRIGDINLKEPKPGANPKGQGKAAKAKERKARKEAMLLNDLFQLTDTADRNIMNELKNQGLGGSGSVNKKKNKSNLTNGPEDLNKLNKVTMSTERNDGGWCSSCKNVVSCFSGRGSDKKDGKKNKSKDKDKDSSDGKKNKKKAFDKGNSKGRGKGNTKRKGKGSGMGSLGSGEDGDEMPSNLDLGSDAAMQGSNMSEITKFIQDGKY